jgi:hypothetical protein
MFPSVPGKINQRFQMKRNILFGTMLLLAGSLFAADSNPMGEVRAAIVSLGGLPNYSWQVTVEPPNGGGRFNGPTDGKTDRSGYICLTMTRDDATIEAVLKGIKGAVKTPEHGWQSLAEFGQATGDRNQFLARQLEDYLPLMGQAANLSGSVVELKKDGDADAGDMTENGAKFLLASGWPATRDKTVTVTHPKGTVKFWVKDGQLLKYEYHVQGAVRFNGKDQNVDETTTVVIKDVGTTQVEVPDEAKKIIEAKKQKK